MNKKSLFDKFYQSSLSEEQVQSIKGGDVNGGQYTNDCATTWVGVNGDHYQCSDDHQSFGPIIWGSTC